MLNITKSMLLVLSVIACAGPARAGEVVAKVEGSLDKDLIRRVVRAHIPEIRFCYNAALERDPKAEGRVIVDFTIGTEGRVTESKIGESTLADAEATECMRVAVARWSFPKPDGGTVAVSYPFVLEPG
jgi:TonB family protein